MNEQHLEVAIQAAKAGAEELMSRRVNRVVREKADKDLVTDADLASQYAIRKILLDAFDDYTFVGEEEGENDPPPAVRRGDPDAPPCWVVDPLDGTINYVHRLQSFAVSIALYAAGKMRLGVIYDPVCNELFTAIDGGEAQCNGQPIQTSGCSKLHDALVTCSFPPGVQGTDPEVERFIRVLEKSQSVRRLGSCALNMCYVAAGRLDAYWATSVSAWDSAAGIVITRQAGAQVTSDQGSTLDPWKPKFCVSANATLHEEMIDLLNHHSTKT